jgi:4-carboxymuconolactone decarboxylase
MTDERRRRGLEMMTTVYGWEVQDGPGDFFAATVDHLFADIWTRDLLSVRDRRLLLLGAVAAQGLPEITEIQAGAALSKGELDAAQLREVALFLTYYVGWPLGTRLNGAVEKTIAAHEKAHRRAAEASE